jgi:hypothetical protein
VTPKPRSPDGGSGDGTTPRRPGSAEVPSNVSRAQESTAEIARAGRTGSDAPSGGPGSRATDRFPPPTVRDPEPLPSGVTNDPATWPGQILQDHVPLNDRFTPDEMAIAQRLAQLGPVTIESNPTGPRRTADGKVDGQDVEFKTIKEPSSRAVKGAIASGTGQSGDIIIDARGTELTQGDAVKGLAAFLNASPTNPGKLTRVRIWGADFDLNWTPEG